MILKVKAYSDCNVLWPFAQRTVGQPAEYVGREFNYETRAYDVKEEPDEFDSDTSAGRRILKLLKQGVLHPANDATARFAGV